MAKRSRIADKSAFRKKQLLLAKRARRSRQRAAGIVHVQLKTGLVIAEQAYGSSVRRSLKLSLDSFQDRTRAKSCTDALSITDTTNLRKGLRLLRSLP